jgi:hypothetical protein
MHSKTLYMMEAYPNVNHRSYIDIVGCDIYQTLFTKKLLHCHR